MKNRVFALLAGLLVAGSMLLVGCDTKNDEPVDTSPVEIATTTPSEESSSEPEETSTPTESSSQFEETSAEPEESSTTPEESSSQPEESSTTPEESSSVPEETETEPDVTETEPKETETEPEETETEPEATETEPETTETGLPTLNGKTPYEAYEGVRDQIDGLLTNCQENSTANQYLTFMGKTALMQTVETVSKVNGNDVEAVVTTVNYMDSTSSVSKSYYKGGWLYGEQNGTTFKAQLTMDQMYAIVYGTDAANEEKILNMPESWFKDVNFTENEDGTYSIRVMLEGDRVEEVIGRLGIADMAAMGMELSDLCYNIVLDAEGNFVSIIYTFRMTMEVQGETMVIDSESIITYTNIGSTTVTLPDGCESYVDVTEQLINSIA